MAREIKAAVMTAPGKMEVQRLPWPDLERGAVLLQMEMSGICGTDKHAYRGEATLYAGTEAEQQIVYPTVHGHENVGTIVEMLPDDERRIEYHREPLRVGDRVTMCPNVICQECWYCRHILAYPFCANNTTIGLSYPSTEHPYVVGGFAEYMYVPPKAWVYKIPDELPTRLAVLTELFVVAGTLDRAKEFSRLEARGFNFGDTVLIQGVGAVGMMFVIRARLLGAGNIIAVDASPWKLQMAREFGADYTIDTSSTTQAERIAYVKDLTEGRGADVVVECVGIPDVLPEGLEMLRRGGTYIETGNFVETGTVVIDVHRHIAAKNVLLIGNTNHAHTLYESAMKMMMKTKDSIPWDRFITGVHKVDDAAAAMKASFRPESLKEVIVP